VAARYSGFAAKRKEILKGRCRWEEISSDFVGGSHYTRKLCLAHSGSTLKDGSGRAVLMPAVALSAYARSADRTKAIRSGFQDHLAKPVEPGELLAVVRQLGRSQGHNSLEIVSDAGCGSGTLRLSRKIPLLFGEKGLKTVCFDSLF
jgi:hypothetical protein